jgi:hypothetical protein
MKCQVSIVAAEKVQRLVDFGGFLLCFWISVAPFRLIISIASFSYVPWKLPWRLYVFCKKYYAQICFSLSLFAWLSSMSHMHDRGCLALEALGDVAFLEVTLEFIWHWYKDYFWSCCSNVGNVGVFWVNCLIYLNLQNGNICNA